MFYLESVEIPGSLQWTDEFSPSDVAQTMRRTLSGRAVLYSAAQSGGRPITLESRADSGWVRRSVVEQLRNMASVPGAVYSLDLRGNLYSVSFRHTDGALEAEPIFPTGTSPDDEVYYMIKLRFITL